MNELRFWVPGRPAPGGSKRVFPIRKGGIPPGKFIVTDAAGQANKDWRASVAHEARIAFTDNPLDGPLEIELEFWLARPKGHFRKNAELYAGEGLKPTAPKYPTTRPDVGKLARSTQDALTLILWRDDSQIVRETHSKGYSAKSGCWIIVREAGKK